MKNSLLFRVAPEIFEKFPDYVVGCVAALGIETSSIEGQVDDLLASAEIRARATFDGVDLKDQPPFAAWRSAFSRAGWSPSRFPASAESLHKRIQRGGELPRINIPVDLANVAVLSYSIPIGAHDIQTFDHEPLDVRLASPGDEFLTVAGENEPPESGEIVYAVGADIRTRRWVWRQGRSSLVSASATDIFFPVDGFADQTLDALHGAMNFLAEFCRSRLGANVHTGFVDRKRPTFSIGR